MHRVSVGTPDKTLYYTHMQFIAGILAVFVSFIGSISSFFEQNPEAAAVQSVEIGLAEMSPRGEAGGFAVPASGESFSCSISLTDNFDGTVRASWTHTFDGEVVAYAPESVFQTFARMAMPVAEAGGGGSGAKTTGTDLTNTALYRCDTTTSACAGGATSVGGTAGWTTIQQTANPSVNGAATASGHTNGHAYKFRLESSYTTTYQGVSGHGGLIYCDNTLTVSTTPPPPLPECRDGIDNDDPEDTLIDYDGGPTTPALPATRYFNSFSAINTAMVPFAGANPSGFYRSDATTINKICSLLGYNAATLGSTHSWSSPGNNYTRYWNGSSWVTVGSGTGGTCTSWHSTKNGPRCSEYTYPYNTGVNTLTCSNPTPPASATPDPGCSSPDDNNEDDAEPSVVLEVINNTDGGGWTGGPIQIATSDNLDLRWNGTDVTSCSGSNFSTGSGSPSDGTQTSVTNPGQGATTTYAVNCTGPHGNASDAVVVHARSGGTVDITADPTILPSGDETTVGWNINQNNPATCSITGPGLSLPTLSGVTGSTDVVIYADSIFTLTCPSDSDSVTVRILPIIQET